MADPIVVVPTRNEVENVLGLIRALGALGLRVLIVDDASPDRTAEVARAAGAEVLVRQGTRGLGPAYRDGFAWALAGGFDPIVQMDADFSHDPADVPRLVATMAGADLALGSRYVAGGGTLNWGIGRRVLSRCGSLYSRAFSGVGYRDLTGGFKCWRAELLGRVLAPPPGLPRPSSDGYSFQVETTMLAHRLGAQIVEVPIVFTERREGRSKMSWAIAIEAARRIPGF
ncbi:MAG: polyprenol monophosphomannose synthase [Myxococcales bacterium]|nr:polyprenol monophosphomannose synthase [Myxococcales bacterium]